MLKGPGTPTSDSMLLWGSRDEFMVRARAAQQPGAPQFLQAFNAGAITMAQIRRALGAYLHIPRFATGGALSRSANQAAASLPAAASSGGGGGAPASSNGIRIVNVLDPNLVSDAISSASGERAIMNVIQKNASGIGRMVR
jgi:hypothetical protein